MTQEEQYNLHEKNWNCKENLYIGERARKELGDKLTSMKLQGCSRNHTID